MVRQITTSLYDQLIADFELRSILSFSSGNAQLNATREKAFSQFKQLGFPNNKVEDWKYINLGPFLKHEFVTEAEEEILQVPHDAIAGASIQALDCYRLVTINGHYRPELSDAIPGEDIVVSALSAALQRPAFTTHFGKYASTENNHFAALNTALFRDGLYVEVKEKAVIAKPIHIIHLFVTGENLFVQPRHLFVIGRQAEISIIETSADSMGNQSAKVFVNSVSEIVVNEQAALQHYNIEAGNEHTSYIHHNEIMQKPSSRYNNYKASFPGTALLRNNLNVSLDGENIESHLYGLYLAGGRQLVDNHTTVDHLKPHCHSNELYKGVMRDESVAVFNGKIFVRKDAQKTNAFQKNNNLMLSKKAVVDSKPQLEIFADDVRCSHGSTIGQFNEDALFYLKARGIGDEKAKVLLVHAFAYDVTEKIPVPEIQAHINHLIEEGLRS